MTLVKKSKIAASALKATAPGPAPAPSAAAPAAPAKKTRNAPARQQTISERVAAATEELAAGLTQASAATKELGLSMEQIAAGAEEAAGASQQQSAGMKRIVASLATAKAEADASGRRAETVLTTLVETNAQISSSIRSIERNAERQLVIVGVIGELERRAKEIGTITQTVSDIADQTNIHALNAAIEAARAGEQGRGFAVVAEEVRTLAETSDKSAQEVQQLSEAIQTDVGAVVAALKSASENATAQAVAATKVVAALASRRSDMIRIGEDSRAVFAAAIEAESAALEAEKGTEEIASAAEEQSSGAIEVQVVVQEQHKSLEQSQIAARALATLSEELRDGAAGASTAEQIGSSAEELSATIQELSGTATEVMAAIEEINRACQLQASATQQTSAALAQIEKSAQLSQRNGLGARERVKALEAGIAQSSEAIKGLIDGVKIALQETQKSVKSVGRLGTVGRKIEKTVNAISMTTLQTGMLAVSGLVEAARGGDAGRGFAVVSTDIRNLAREASENIDRAKDTVRDILDQVAALERELDQIIVSAELEVQNNQAVSLSLEKISLEIEALGAGSALIVEGADAILTAAVEAAAGARQVASAAEEASAASREAASAAAEQAQGAEDLAAAIEEIASLADELKLQNA
ncbi:methyl-accepting chemotaxis protein [Paraburkholderia sp. DHOC27]|uniref:methyl-accepting chemotaxis protein n=1 Tax=Paraburkholderia sp. DHOC27 TaxID=2303330 RepID=UPI000E3CEE1D|nr:methyl-accepting chemotaxis protein [Paraburkholderia sp. DHOC27]RFU44508.1 methyl-accepting chemotaxis protein [Paraburkholderia sp. DHOC27]